MGIRATGTASVTRFIGAALLLGAVAPLSFSAAQDDDLSELSKDTTLLGARRLRVLFLDSFGRPPTRAERDAWHEKPAEELVDEFLERSEFWENWLEEQLYYFLLVDNFRPRSERVLAIPSGLASGRLGVREALHSIVLSSGFDLRNPGPDTFVTVVLEQLHGKTVQDDPRELEIGKHVYDGGQGTFLGKRGSSQSDVVRITIEDRQALRFFLTREHRRILRSEPPKRELARWVRQLEKDDRSYPSLLREWFSSTAYDRRLETFEPLSNRAFVRALFVDLTDQLPPEEDARRLRNALDGLADAGPLRAVVARLVVDSGNAEIPPREGIEDPTAWIDGLFERFLGRQASEAELTVFVSAYHDAQCRPETVVYAIVSHPEYQIW